MIARLTLLSLLLASPATNATTIVPLSPEQVRERASAVIVATIVDELVWLEPATSSIRTDLVLQDVELLWSDDDHFFPEVLTYTGGELNGRGMAIPGMPTWPIGQQALFFVEGDGQSEACPTVGWSQGLFLVDEGGAMLDLEGLPLSVTPGRQLLRSSTPGPAALDSIDISTTGQPALRRPDDPSLLEAMATPLDLDALRELLSAQGGQR